MLFFLVFIFFAVLFICIKLKYFTLYGPIPGKSPQFLFGNILQTGIHRGRLVNDITKQFQDEYGDTFQILFGFIRLIFVRNPDDVEHIFTHRHIYDRGHLHVNQHRIFSNDALEIREFGDDKHSRMTIEQVEFLIFLDCVIQEVLRFIPPVFGTSRAVTMNDQLPGSGIRLLKGDELFIPFYNLARDKRCWKIDPDLFYPERFQGEDKDHHVYASIPFGGGGHRQCIGQDLARFELKTIIVRLMQHVTFGDGSERVNTGGYVQRLITTPKNMGVTLTFD